MVWCFLGDGAEDEGHLYEAARYVDGWELPCKFIIEDNDRSVNAPKAVRWGKSDKGKQPDCVWRYSYTPTWPHGGTGRNKWLEFKTQAVVLPEPQKQWLNYPVKEDIRDGVRMPYKTAVKQSMEMLARIPNTIFIGYNVRYGSAYGTLADVPEEQRLETPVAENLMAGLAMGMSLLGFKPILFFERHDFIFNAMDALVNQVDKITMITRGEFVFPIIIRAVAGSVKPFYAGLTHTSDLVRLFQHSFYFPVVVPMTAGEVLGVYEEAAKFDRPVLVVEYKELHG
jgi:deoxyxylulose-5-phosphate synthase